MKKYKFLFSDESVNAYGTRVLTEGIRLGDYEKNPIILWNHTRSWSDKKDQILPIGKCVKLWVENNKLYGEVVFDQKDEFAKKIEAKVDQGILSACSISIAVITTSDDQSVIVSGQRRPTIVESALREVSIVDIPANKNAVRLVDDSTGKEINLSDNEESFLLPILNKGEMNFKDNVSTLLSLQGKSEEEMMAVIKSLSEKAAEVDGLKTKVTQLSDQLQTYKDKDEEEKTQQITDLVDGAIKDKKITAKEKDTYVALAEKDFENTSIILKNKAVLTELNEDNDDTDETPDPWEQRFSEIDENVKNRY